MSEHEPFDFNKAFPPSPDHRGHPPTKPAKGARRRGGGRIIVGWIFVSISLLGSMSMFLQAFVGQVEPEEAIVVLNRGFDFDAFAEVSAMITGRNTFSLIAIILALCAWKYRRIAASAIIVIALVASVFATSALFLPMKTYRAGHRALGAAGFEEPRVVLGRILGEFSREAKQHQADYTHSIVLNRFTNVLLPERLVDAAMIEDARTRTRLVSDELEKATTNVLAAQSRAVQSVSSANLSDAERILIRRILQQFIEETNKINTQTWDYERAILNEAIALLDHMERCVGRCTFENGMLYFDDDEDILLYNAHIGLLQGIAREQSRVIEPLHEYLKKIDVLLESGQLPTRLPTIPVPASANFTVSIDCKQVIINDHPIHLPTTLATLEAVLGTEYRTIGDTPHTWVWDELGIMCYIGPYAEEIDSFVLQLRPYDEEASPRQPFVGSITMFNRPFTRLDSPVTFNRPRESWLFFPLNEAGTFWRTPDDELVTWIQMNNDGLMGHIDVSPPLPESDDTGDVPF